jgi:cytochrome oxidase assembly protein ShyY1
VSERVRRTIATLAVAALVSTACVLLGLWQWHRYVNVSAAVATVEANYGATPVALADALPGGGPVPDADVWRPVTVTGHYLPDSTVLLRNRPVDGQRGFHVLAAFAVDTGGLAGRVVVVDRGWLTVTGQAADVPAVPPAPTGTVELVGRLRAAEAATTREAPAGQVQAFDPGSVRRAAATPWAAPSLDAYLQAITENGSAPRDLGPLQLPSTDLGPHLSYAFQWWVFATGSLVGAVILLRREGAPVRPPRRRGTAELEEDALLDAQEEAARAAGPHGAV